MTPETTNTFPRGGVGGSGGGGSGWVECRGDTTSREALASPVVLRAVPRQPALGGHSSQQRPQARFFARARPTHAACPSPPAIRISSTSTALYPPAPHPPPPPRPHHIPLGPIALRAPPRLRSRKPHPHRAYRSPRPFQTPSSFPNFFHEDASRSRVLGILPPPLDPPHPPTSPGPLARHATFFPAQPTLAASLQRFSPVLSQFQLCSRSVRTHYSFSYSYSILILCSPPLPSPHRAAV